MEMAIRGTRDLLGLSEQALRAKLEQEQSPVRRLAIQVELERRCMVAGMSPERWEQLTREERLELLASRIDDALDELSMSMGEERRQLWLESAQKDARLLRRMLVA